MSLFLNTVVGILWPVFFVSSKWCFLFLVFIAGPKFRRIPSFMVSWSVFVPIKPMGRAQRRRVPSFLPT